MDISKNISIFILILFPTLFQNNFKNVRGMEGVKNYKIKSIKIIYPLHSCSSFCYFLKTVELIIHESSFMLFCFYCLSGLVSRKCFFCCKNFEILQQRVRWNYMAQRLYKYYQDGCVLFVLFST